MKFCKTCTHPNFTHILGENEEEFCRCDGDKSGCRVEDCSCMEYYQPDLYEDRKWILEEKEEW